MNNVQFSNFMMMNNQNNQNNSNDFPDQSKVAQFFNQANNMNQNNMMNNNMNNNMNMMSSMNMNNNMGMNNNMNMNNMYMINNNMNNMGMNNMNNMNMCNMPNNNMGMNNFQMMNFNNMNNMHLMNNNMNNMGMNNMNMNNNMGMNNMNNMALVRRNSNGNNFQINWYGNNFLPNNMNSQNNLYVMKFLQNQMLQRQYYQMMFQQRMFYQMQRNILERNRKMSEILDRNFNNNNINNNNIIEQVDINLPIVNRNNEQDFTPNQALLDVIQEPNPPQQNQNNNQDQNNPILPSDLVSEVIVNVMNLNPDLLSGLGNNLLGEWAQGENRGGRPYKPPNGWIGYGLNVLNKYDNGNNDWLACNGRPGEWCIAYHGACNGQSSDNVKKGIKCILETNLRPGGGQACQNHSDLNHPGQKVGVGVYCSPEPSVIDGYAGIMNINGHNYKAAFMLRVKPDKIRISSSTTNYWVVNGDFAELRPYRLLIKPC